MGEITESKAWHDNAAIKGSTVLKIAQREGVELPSGTILSRGWLFHFQQRTGFSGTVIDMDRCSYMDESAANSEGYADTEVVGSLSLPLAQQDLQVESRADTPLEQPASAGHARKNFAAAADAILLRAVNVVKHWEAAKGTNEEL
ncbi:hypothetical protein PC118_g9944 [Phytophthora cactorum]|uniref:Uncharacterized protein n=1 Tax=Phytophthora cactorum TaxID=29920 RepID=A0A8T1FYW8_9STRA|nr:hypothetical protein PC112_g11429 [Phytophthora cactorum]KAG2982476.1 hypothetical protein PC118_g9944 [Phytophthora cactorum]